MTELDSDARALIKAARHGDDPTASERAQALERFRSALTATSEQRRPRLPGGARTVGSKPRAFRTTVPWFVAATVLSGSLAALADWADVLPKLERVFSATLSEAPNGASSTDPTPPRYDRRRAKPSQPLWPAAPDVAEQSGAEPPRPNMRVLLDGAQSLDSTAPDSTAVGPVRHPPATPARAGATHSPARPPMREKATHTERPSEVLPELGPELTLIVAARDAFERRHYAEARRLLAMHAASDVSGNLAQERQTIAALVDCFESGDTRAAERYVQRWPSSVFAARIVRDCRLDSNSVSSAPGVDTHPEQRHVEVP